ncbi:MAG TPA: hypothetical protein ENL42_04225 [Thermoplasmatales archaeon]|nr:hypothetical protein [Thermoplasmatales archaeon]
MHRVKIEIESEYGDIIFNSLKYEEAPRAKIKWGREGNKIFIEIEADTISNLRAAINSFAKWIDMVERIAKNMEEIRSSH